jgi:hypothetical protein
MKLFNKTTNYPSLFDKSKTLTELANLFETDKGNSNPQDLSWGKDFPNHSCMSYTTTYEKYMINYRELPIKFFEMGICDKRFPYASQKMWLSYFKNIDLYGADNFWGNYLHEKIEEIESLNKFGANFVYADQGNFCDWNEIKKECPNDFDFFIEDGSHWPNHMAVTLWQAKDLMKSGGYYFMEDLQNPKVSRGMFKYDNSLFAENLLETQKTGIFNSHFLNDVQNYDLNISFDLVEMVLDPKEINYLVVLKRK